MSRRRHPGANVAPAVGRGLRYVWSDEVWAIVDGVRDLQGGESGRVGARAGCHRSLRSWLRPPPSEDPDQALRGAITHWLLLTAIVVIAPLTALIPIVESDYRYSLPIYVVALGGAIAILVVLHLGFIRTAGALFATLAWLTTMWAAFASGGVGSPQLSMGVLCIIITGFIWSGPAAIGMAVATSVSLLGIELARDFGIAPAPFIDASRFTVWMALSTVLALSAVFLLIFRRTMDAAREEAARKSLRLEEEMRRREKAEATLHRSQKLEALGRLAGGIAHDFNNILTVLLAESEMLEAHVRSGRPLGEAEIGQIADIRASSERASALTTQLLAFSRRRIGAPAVVELQATVRRMAPMLMRLVREDVRLDWDFEASGASVRIDDGQLEQVLMNLVLNARDAMPRGGRLSIATRCVDIDQRWVDDNPDASPGPHVVLEVSDTGVGIAPDDLDSIFDPFFTTKGPGAGTGLGLASAHGMVIQAGGHITVESELGRGTCFRVYLPDVRERPSVAANPSDPRSASGRSGTVLLCEDDAVVRRVIQRVLTAAGLEVVEADCAESALEWLRARDTAFDLLISDIVMPGMNGRELASIVTSERPEIRILLVSGYAADAIDAGDALPGVGLLEKPFTPADLVARATALLGADG